MVEDDDQDEPGWDEFANEPRHCGECHEVVCYDCGCCHECNCDELKGQWCEGDDRYVDPIPDELRVSEGL